MKKIFLFLIAISLVACEKDDISNLSADEVNFTYEIKNQFSLNNFEDEYVRENLKVNWIPISQFEAGKDTVEYGTNLHSTAENSINNLHHKYSIAAFTNEKKEWDFYVIKYTSSDSTSLIDLSEENLGEFSGTIKKFDTSGNLITMEGVEDGTITSTFNRHSKTSNNKYYPAEWEDPSDSRWVTVRTYFYTDYWSLLYNSYGQLTGVTYLGSYHYNTRTEYIYVPANEPAPGMGDSVGDDTYHQHDNAPHGPAVSENPHPYEEELEEEPAQIINQLEGRTNCIYNKMVDGNNNINWILENFNDGTNPSQFDLILRMSTTLGNLTNASTVKSGDVFYININANLIPYRSSLEIARTILHEGIHARLREFASRKGSNSVTFPGVYDYFRRYEKNWDHQQMADFYRETIAEGLKQYDNSQHSWQYYMDLAWEGLSEIVDENNVEGNAIIYTEAWSKLSDSDKQRVLTTISNEKQNGSKICENK